MSKKSKTTTTKAKVTGGTFALVYHSVLSRPLQYDASPEEIDKEAKRLLRKVKRKESSSV